jgi:hypothetical protein
MFFKVFEITAEHFDIFFGGIVQLNTRAITFDTFLMNMMAITLAFLLDAHDERAIGTRYFVIRSMIYRYLDIAAVFQIGKYLKQIATRHFCTSQDKVRQARVV